MKKKETKKVFLSNGEEAELLTQYQDGNMTEYVVKVVIGENNYFEGENELVYENRIVSSVYDNYEDIPKFLRKTELENKVEELNKNIQELNEQKSKITKELKSVYNPKYPIGTPIFYTQWGSGVEELEIVRIEFTEREDESFYYYYCNKEYRSFGDVGDYYFLTKEEAEKARQKYIQEEEEKEKKQIIENYKKAKEEYKKIYN